MEMESSKSPLILGIDPAPRNCGFGLIGLEKGEYVHSFRQELRPYKKSKPLTQSQVDGYIANNVKKVIDKLFLEYNIQYVVIELQFSQFSIDRIQLSFVQALPQNVPYVVQHSKLKLQHKEIMDIENLMKSHTKYKQNKHQGQQLAKILFPNTPDLTFDECDSLLHAKYAFNNLAKIGWVLKSELE